jgi:hypothetical protein
LGDYATIYKSFRTPSSVIDTCWYLNLKTFTCVGQ